MKTAFSVLVLFLTLACANASETNEPPLKISIAVPLADGQRVIECRDTNSHFHVILSNVSDRTQRIWPEDVPPGYDALTFQLTTDNGRTWTARKVARSWLRVYSRSLELGPGDSVVFEVYYANRSWQMVHPFAEQGRAPFVLGFPHPGDSGKGVTMKAIYENVPCPAAEHHKVWVGRIESQPATYVFRRR